ncbi:Gfo/Idh/MocA family protein, partial [Burkholderia cenocepacia]|uniref:Gfo/Idh/MocA family protein n=1 Tax=Burkholderia cenocepacia TaxID=95486 RepID=UPI00406BE238
RSRRPPWRRSLAHDGARPLALASHLVDQALPLFGTPETVSTTVKTRRVPVTAPDIVHLLLGYPDKDVALHASALSAIEPARFTLHGTRGSYQTFGLDTQEDQPKAGLTADDVAFAGGHPPGRLRVLDGHVEVARPGPTPDGKSSGIDRPHPAAG